MVQDSRCGKFDNAQQILILQIVRRVQAAAGQQGILDAGCQQLLITYLQIQTVQFLQQTVWHVIGQVLQMVAVDFINGTAGLFHELLPNV